MIHSHCGVKLLSIRSYHMGRRLGQHAWKCAVCGRNFTQHTRQPKKKEVVNAPT